MYNSQFSIKNTKFPDLIICSAFFLFSFIITLYYPDVFLGIIILLSFGFIINTLFIKSDALTLTEHIIAGVGIGLMVVNILMASLVYIDKTQWFKEILLLLFLFSITASVIKRKINAFKPYSINREDIFPWIIVLMFFFASILLRHADFRLPDEYMYLNKIKGIVSGGYISDYAQDRYFFHYSYAAILEFAALTFKSAEMVSLFFVSMSLIPTYLLGKELFNKNAGYVAVLFLAFNPSIIFYSIRLLTEVPLIFLIASFLYFLYKWSKSRNTTYFFISCVFILIAVLVKLHGIIFLGIGTIYMLSTFNIKNFYKNTKYLFIFISLLILFSIIWNLHGNIYTMLQGLFSRIVNEISSDVIWVGYKLYITSFAPDLYSMPFVVLFFFGTAAFLKEPIDKKIFLLMPIAVYALLISLAGGQFGMGVRNFLVNIPLMSVLAAYGIVQDGKLYRSVFWILSGIYLIILAIMVIYAPRFPHLNFILPDLPVWIRVLTFSAAFIVTILIMQGWGIEKVQKTQYLIISLVIISSLLNANFFINMQEGYPDSSKSGISDAGKWLSENTPQNASIQSSTWELPFWMDTNTKSNPGTRYPESTFLSYYVNKTTFAAPYSEEVFLERIKNKEVDYVVIFTDMLLTSSDETGDTYKYLQKYVNETPGGTDLVYTQRGERGNVLFRVYKVI
jgi:hypothetical protein